MTERELIDHWQARFDSLMEGHGTPNERAVIARWCLRDIERMGIPPCLADLYRQFAVIVEVAMATWGAARKLHGLPWWGWINHTNGDADFTSHERLMEGETRHDLYQRALDGYVQVEPRARQWRRQYITKQLSDAHKRNHT